MASCTCYLFDNNCSRFGLGKYAEVPIFHMLLVCHSIGACLVATVAWLEGWLTVNLWVVRLELFVFEFISVIVCSWIPVSGNSARVFRLRRAANLKLLEATDAEENVLPNMIYRKEREASAVSVARAQKTKPAVQLIALKIAMLFC